MGKQAGFAMASLPRRHWVALAAAFWVGLTLVLAGQARADVTTLDIDGHQSGRVFQGLGATSGGGTSRLLYDYPEPYRSQVLDYLFKPNYGASLQVLKVGIGGDANGAVGGEASHMHTRDDLSFDRGYEWWLMREAKKRNPNIVFSAIHGSIPGWVGDGDYFSRDNIDYLVNFLKGAKRKGLTVDYIGTVNETTVIHQQMDWEWVKGLKRAIVKAGLKTKLVVNDEPVRDCCPTYLPWKPVDAMLADPELRGAVDVVGSHYAGGVVPQTALDLGIPIWSTEDGPWTWDWNTFLGGSYAPYAQVYNRNYITGRMTSTQIYNLVSAYYDNLLLPKAGMMRADQPWSGWYDVKSPIWITAQTTQFARPGWQYLDGASKLLPDDASVVALKSPNGSDYSAIFETMASTNPQTVQVHVGGGLSNRTVHVWRTTEHEWFTREADIAPVDGTYSITLQPGAVYSITTTSGQRKGQASLPSAKPFPLPYRDDFEDDVVGQQPRYLSQQGGSYELTDCAGGRPGRCVEQVVSEMPTQWLDGWPTTFLGDPNWTDYAVETDLRFLETGSADLLGRIGNAGAGGGADPTAVEVPRAPDAYYLQIQKTGRWELGRIIDGERRSLKRGWVTLPPKLWHHARLAFTGSTISAAIDGSQVVSVTDTTYAKGRAGIATGWNRVQFDNFGVSP